MKEQNTINTFKSIKELEEYRAQINEMCDERKKFITLCEEAEKLSSKPFVFIKESFEAISPELFKTNEGKKIMNKYAKLIRESSSLRALHSAYENIRKAGKDTDTDFFINNMTEAFAGVNHKTKDSEVKSLGRILAEGYLYLGETARALIPEEKSSLNALSKAVEFVLENKKSSKNIAEYSNASKVIKNHISSNGASQNMFEAVDLDALAKRLVEDFNVKYSDKLTVEEANALREISSS